jgi:dolichyl-phosphate beta-glucosyltransferase
VVDLSVVVPAFNEEKRLGQTLPEMVRYLAAREGSSEIIVADDGSSDGTASLVESFANEGVRLVRLPQNRGKGGALKEGVAASSGRLVLLTDADLSTPIAEVERLEAHLDQADLVFGSRAVSGATIAEPQPIFRQWMGKVFNLMIRIFVVGGIHDTQCGFKLLEGEAARVLFEEMFLDGFAYDVELLWLARRRGLRVAEVGVVWNHCPDSKVRLLSDPVRMASDIVRFRLHHARRRRG